MKRMYPDALYGLVIPSHAELIPTGNDLLNIPFNQLAGVPIIYYF